MVINVGAIKSGDWLLVKRDIEGVVNAVKGRAKVKVIIEACLLTDEEKVKACTVAKLVGAAFVKTSTGYSTGGATVEDVRLMRETVGPRWASRPPAAFVPMTMPLPCSRLVQTVWAAAPR